MYIEISLQDYKQHSLKKWRYHFLKQSSYQKCKRVVMPGHTPVVLVPSASELLIFYDFNQRAVNKTVSRRIALASG